jgi:hypothetical protein
MDITIAFNQNEAKAVLETIKGSDNAHLMSLERLLTSELARLWNPGHDQEAECKCGHSYYRHFDSWEGMEPVGCKYCECWTFEE